MQSMKMSPFYKSFEEEAKHEADQEKEKETREAQLCESELRAQKQTKKK